MSMALMKNINGRVSRGHGGELAFCDMSMLKIIMKDKKRLEFLRIKIICEEFLEYVEYEVFIDRQWFMRMSWNRMTKETEPIEYNEEFMEQYKLSFEEE